MKNVLTTLPKTILILEIELRQQHQKQISYSKKNLWISTDGFE